MSFCRKELKIAQMQNMHEVFVKMMEEAGYKVMYAAIIIPFVLSGNTLRAEDIFFVMTASVMIRIGMGEKLPQAIYLTSEMYVSIKRFQVRR